MGYPPPARPDQFASLDAAMELARQGNPWASDARLRSDTQENLRQREDGTWVWKADPQLSTMRLRDIDDTELLDGRGGATLPHHVGPGHRQHPGV